MDWKPSLDKWLTTPPDDGFDDFYESVINGFTDEFYEKNESWTNIYEGQCEKWIYNLYYKYSFSPKEASLIIERAYK